MRILQLTSHLDVGGITTYVVGLSEALAARGHDVTVVSGGGASVDRLTSRGIAHWRLPLRTSAEFSPQIAWAAWRLGRALAARRVDVIHAHTRVAQVTAHLLWTTHRIPYVTTWHGFYRPRWSRRWWPCTGEATIAISEPVARHLRDAFAVPRERIRLIPHGVDVARFAQPPDAGEQARFRERVTLPSANGPVIGTVARLVPSKGVDQLLEGFRDLRSTHPAAVLVIIGDGPQRAALERLAARLGVASSVRFAGTIPDTRAALAVMDLFVFLPATREGFGLSLLEAMASGKPIVSIRRGGGASWVLEDSRVGVMVEPRPSDGRVAPQQLARAMARVLDDSAQARQLGARAEETASARYDAARMIEAVEAVYREVVRVP